MSYWPPSDNDEDHGIKIPSTIMLSEDNARIVSVAFNLGGAKRIRKGFCCLEIQETRCTRLDPNIKAISKVKTINTELLRVHALMHNPVAPLIWLLHTCDNVETPISIDDAKEAIVESIQLLRIHQRVCQDSDGGGF